MKKILVLVLFILIVCVSGVKSGIIATPQTNSIESASDQAQVLPTATVAPTPTNRCREK